MTVLIVTIQSSANEGKLFMYNVSFKPVVLRLEYAPESPDWLVKIRIAGPHPQSLVQKVWRGV